MATITFNDMVNEVHQEIDDKYRSAPWKSVCIDIDNIIKELNGLGMTGKTFSQYTAEELSNFGGVLSVLRSSLIQGRYEVFSELKIRKTHLKVREGSVRPEVKKALSAGSSKPTASDIEVETQRHLARQQLTMDMVEAEYERLQSYWYSIPDVLYRIEARLNILKEDSSTAKFYNGGDSALTNEDNRSALDFSSAMDSRNQ